MIQTVVAFRLLIVTAGYVNERHLFVAAKLSSGVRNNLTGLEIDANICV